jgi:hypothetical protein
MHVFLVNYLKLPRRTKYSGPVERKAKYTVNTCTLVTLRENRVHQIIGLF